MLQNEEVVACTDGAQEQENLARETLSQGGGWAVRGAQCSLSVVSPDSGLTYVYLSGGASLLRTTRRLTWVALALCGALGALSTVLALSLSRRLYQPVGVLINALIARGRLSERATNSELIGMGQVLDEVLVDNSKMRRMLEEMGPAIDEAAFRNVVYHAGVGEGVKWLAPLTGEKLCVVRVRAGRCAPMDMEALTLSLCGELRALLGARITVRAVRDEGSVCLICSHSLDDSHFRRWFAGQMADFEASTLEKRGLPMCYYVSENASLPAGGEARVELLCRLHGQCRSLLERGWLTGMRSGGLWQEDCGVQPDRSLLLMNLATGQEIMRSLRAGDDSAWQQAQMLIDLNVGDGAGSYAGMRKLLGSLLELVYRVDVETLRSAGVEEYSRTLERLLDTDTLPESVEQLRQIYESVCSCRAGRGAFLLAARRGHRALCRGALARKHRLARGGKRLRPVGRVLLRAVQAAAGRKHCRADQPQAHSRGLRAAGKGPVDYGDQRGSRLRQLQDLRQVFQEVHRADAQRLQGKRGRRRAGRRGAQAE